MAPKYASNHSNGFLKQLGRRNVLLILLLLLALPFLGVGAAAALDPYDCKIADQVTVGGLDVGGMTLLQARNALQEASEAVLERMELPVSFPEATISLSPDNTKVSVNSLSAAWAAYKVARFGPEDPTIGLTPHLQLEDAYLRSQIDRYADQYDTSLTQSSLQMSGSMPDLSLSSTDAPQTLELTMGLPTARLDREDAYRQILAVYDRAFSAAQQGLYLVPDHFRVEILEIPDAPDLKAIYDDVSVAPVNDSLDMERYQVIPGAYGYHFDLNAAQSLVDAAEYGETISISMEFQEPEIHGDAVYFRDVLGSCETPHTKDENRNHNLRTACASLNGVILQPGETFSYNQTLGERNKANGYLPAPAYSGWELVQSYGGGICQGSSTVYCAVLYADLEVVQRVNHGKKVGYMDPGLDATVSWWGPDFQFRNNTHFPVKIAAEVSDGFVKVSILGTEERSYYVEMETEQGYGSDVLYTRSYKCKYDRETGELISRELEARSNYMI